MTYHEVISHLHANAQADQGIYHPELQWCQSCGANIICYEFKGRLGSYYQCLSCNDQWHPWLNDPSPFLVAQPLEDL